MTVRYELPVLTGSNRRLFADTEHEVVPGVAALTRGVGGCLLRKREHPLDAGCDAPRIRSDSEDD